jgi:hypothetical protein
MNFTTTQMRTLSAERSAVQDAIRGREIGTVERGYAVGRMRHAVADARTAPSPLAGFTGREIGRALVDGRAAKRPKTEQALPRLIARERDPGIGDAAPADDELPTLEELGIGDSARDAEPSVMSLYNGKPFVEGRAAHNAWLVSHGRGPIPHGRR